MAIISGAGNPAGGSFTGPAEALEIYGDFAAAYSGQVQIDTSVVTHLAFTTGNYLFVGDISMTGPMKVSVPLDGYSSIADIKFNGVGLMKLQIATGGEDMPSEAVLPLIIPAYTVVLVEVLSTADAAGFSTSVNVTGRIYR